MQPRWNRSQPFVDYILDCLEKARGLGFGKAITIYDNALLRGDMKVGKNIFIGTFIVLDGFGDLEIGDQFPNSLGVQTYIHFTTKTAISGGTMQPEHAIAPYGYISYIELNAIISKGVTLGEGSVIRSNMLGNNDLPDGQKPWGTQVKIMRPINNA